MRMFISSKKFFFLNGQKWGPLWSGKGRPAGTSPGYTWKREILVKIPARETHRYAGCSLSGHGGHVNVRLGLGPLAHVGRAA